jgi:transposase InsO family protein
VKKFGNIPDGGGWRYVGRQQGNRNRQATPDKSRSKSHDIAMRHAFVHTVIDDHSRVAYAEVHDDETAITATAALARAVAWYSARGITIERVLSDNGSAYKSHLWHTVCDQLGITVKKTRPTGPRPTARSNASTAPWPTAGPTPATTSQRPNAETPWPAGSTNTITTGHTQPSEPIPDQPINQRPRSVQLDQLVPARSRAVRMRADPFP